METSARPSDAPAQPVAWAGAAAGRDVRLPDDLAREEVVRGAQRLRWFVAASWLVVPVFALPYALVPHTRHRALMILAWGIGVLATPWILGWRPGRSDDPPHPKRLSLAAHGFVAVTFGALCVETAFFGGLRAASTYYLPLLPGLAVLLAGRGAALPWALACGAATVAACVVDLHGWLAPEELGRTESLLNTTATMLLGVFLATVLARVFEGQKQAALARLARERAGFAWRALHDALTGLPNRALLDDRLATALARSRRSGGGVAVVYVDLDGFKEVNDTEGHAAGDALLCRVADRLRKAMRASDTLARVGGDEFAVVAEGVRSRRDVEALRRNLRAALSDPTAGEEPVAASLGAALHPGDGDDAASLLEAADAAMYREKRARRSDGA